MKISDALYGKPGTDGKKVWLKVGVFIEKENGKLSVKLDAIPIGFDGWIVASNDSQIIDTEEKREAF